MREVWWHVGTQGSAMDLGSTANHVALGTAEYSHNDVIKFDSDIVKYVYGKAVGIFLCDLIRAGA